MEMSQKTKQVFTLKDATGVEQRYTVGNQGQLVPLIEIVEKKESWQAVNTIAETCKILKLGRNTLMGLINAGQLRAVKAGAKRWLVTGKAIEDFLEQVN